MLGKKWYIFNDDGKPLCWTRDDGSEPCLYFDTAKDAYIFLAHSFTDEEFLNLNVEVKNILYFYDTGQYNATGLIPIEDKESLVSYKII